jgi:hypothetical protein
VVGAGKIGMEKSEIFNEKKWKNDRAILGDDEEKVLETTALIQFQPQSIIINSNTGKVSDRLRRIAK